MATPQIQQRDEDRPPAVAPEEKEKDDITQYPSMQKRIMIMISVYLSVFLVTLVIPKSLRVLRRLYCSC